MKQKHLLVTALLLLSFVSTRYVYAGKKNKRSEQAPCTIATFLEKAQKDGARVYNNICAKPEQPLTQIPALIGTLLIQQRYTISRSGNMFLVSQN